MVVLLLVHRSFQSYYYIFLFVSFFDISVSLGNLLARALSAELRLASCP